MVGKNIIVLLFLWEQPKMIQNIFSNIFIHHQIQLEISHRLLNAMRFLKLAHNVLNAKIMGIFKEYRRSQIAEMREVTKKDISIFNNHGFIHIPEYPFGNNISISDADKK